MTTKAHKAQWLRDNLKKGEIYAGIILGYGGEPDYHLVLLAGRDNKQLTWAQAKQAAKDAGGELPNRRELRLLWVNAKAEFQPDWYWSSEQHASDSDCAWYQDFSGGNQSYYHEGNHCRARAVRRLPIE